MNAKIKVFLSRWNIMGTSLFKKKAHYHIFYYSKYVWRKSVDNTKLRERERDKEREGGRDRKKGHLIEVF